MTIRKIYQQSTDDCMRAAICTITGLNPRLFPDYAIKHWFIYWQERLSEYGFAIVEAHARYLAGISNFPGLWIASPPSLHDAQSAHAVVMRADKLFHDPGLRRPNYTQARIEAWLEETNGSALLVVPTYIA